jgi:putative aldouronate transport system substrate-binding protein
MDSSPVLFYDDIVYMYHRKIFKEVRKLNLKRRLFLFTVMFAVVLGTFGVSGAANKNNKSNKTSYLNATGFPIVKKPITLKVMIMTTVALANPKDILVFKEYEKMTGIKIDWIVVNESNVKEKVALSLAGQDLPDAYMKVGMTTSDQLKYGSQGLLVDLNKYIKYAPNFKKFLNAHHDAKKGQTFDNGAIYSFPEGVEIPAVRVAKKLFINSVWLKKLNKKMPATTAELYEVLKEFKENDPNGNGKADEIPLTALKLEDIVGALKGAWGLGNRGILPDNIDADPKTGKIRFIPVSPQYKELVTYLKKLYAEGLMDKEIFSINRAQFTGKAIEGVIGLCPRPTLADFGENHVHEYEGLSTALKGPEEHRLWAMMRPYIKSTGTFMITSSNKYPEATMRWVDYFYSNQGTKFYHYGIEGKSCKKLSNGKYEWMDKIYEAAKQPGTTFDSVIGKYTPFIGGTNPVLIKEPYFSGTEMDPVPYKASMNLMPYAPKEVWPQFTYTQDENDRLIVLQTDIDGYVKKMLAEFIFGKTPLTEWDNYVNQVKKMGLNELLKIHEAAYLRYKK